MSSPSELSTLLHAAKDGAKRLKVLLKTNDIASPQVEAARIQLRRQYAAIVDCRPPSSRLLDIINVLWQDTSHAFIHRYRQKVTALDKTLADRKAPRKEDVGPVARRKLVQAFRTFLAAEEAYWSEFLVQLVVSFEVREALPCLRALGISSTRLGSERSTDSGAQGQTPLNTQVKLQAHQRAVLLVHRALICYGDLTRYRELYNDKNGKGAKNGTTAQEGDHLPPKWAKAAEAYHQARLLVPDNGYPSNQLAVIASYSHDTLSAVYHYYRAICVKQVFREARSNLALTFKKIIQKYKSDGTSDKLSIYQAFVDDFTVLQGLIFLRHDIAAINAQLERTINFFSTCLNRRLITSEAIVKVLCTCLAAWFDVRILGSVKTEAGTETAEKTPGELRELEACVLAIALEFIGAVLVESGASINALAKEEGADVMPAASRIAPVLRRALPAIRIVSKWILSHAELLRGASDFWPKYVDFINAVSAAFQQGNLPDLPVETILEENIDMAGFLPVSQMLRTAAPSSAVTGVSVVNAAHPNEEHLMRVADVLADAALLASNASLPIAQENDRFVVRAVSALNPATASFLPSASPYEVYEAYQMAEIEEDEDVEDAEFEYTAEEGTADADIVDLAVRAGTMATHTGDDDDDEDDEILFPSRVSPKPAARTSPSMAGLRLPSETRGSPGQTASDLLLQVLNGPGGAAATLHARHGGEVREGASSEPVGMGASIWAPSNASELPPPNAYTNAAWSHPFGAAPLARDRPQQFPYG